MFTCLKWILTIAGIFFVSDMLLYLIIRKKIKDNVRLSDLMGILAAEFGIYIICALVFSIWVFIRVGVQEGCIMLLFAISPFIIGRLANYKTRYLFTFVQFLCIILNIVYGFIGFK